MLFWYIFAAYIIINSALGIIIFLKSKRSITGLFYLICIFFLLCFGAAGFLMKANISPELRDILEKIIVFLFSVFPFLFMHFIIVFVGRYNILKSKLIITSIYFTGLFSYTLVLLGLISKPYFPGGGLTPSGYIFYITWMSIFFSIGVAQIYSLYSGFSDRGVKSNLILTGFVLLLLILPGPFTESIFSTFSGHWMIWYLLVSILALMISVYFIFRHKTIVTLYDAVKMTLSVMNDIIIKTDESLKIEMVRGAIKPLLGYDEKDLPGRYLNEILAQEDYLEAYRRYAFLNKMKEGYFDVDVIKKNGELQPINFSFTPVYENDEIISFVCVGRDNTFHKKSEAKIKAALEEKEILLKEIHHRVKNNLQIISSMLYFQTQQIQDESTLQIFLEGQNRIKTLALIHEKLYQSDDLININIQEYIKSLADSLLRSYGVAIDRIQLTTDIKEVNLSVETCITLGLIVNELLSNSLKYAFPDKQKGNIYISLEPLEGNEFRVTVRDNGIGLPEDFRSEDSNTLGLQLVKSLVNQLRGKLDFENSGGTVFSIEFKDSGDS